MTHPLGTAAIRVNCHEGFQRHGSWPQKRQFRLSGCNLLSRKEGIPRGPLECNTAQEGAQCGLVSKGCDAPTPEYAYTTEHEMAVLDPRPVLTFSSRASLSGSQLIRTLVNASYFLSQRRDL